MRHQRIPRGGRPSGEMLIGEARVGSRSLRLWKSLAELTGQFCEDCTLGHEPVTQSGRTSAFHGAGRIDVGVLSLAAEAAHEFRL